jgi:hypothetical protein
MKQSFMDEKQDIQVAPAKKIRRPVLIYDGE